MYKFSRNTLVRAMIGLIASCLMTPLQASSLSVPPPRPGQDATPILTEMIEKCAAEGIHELILAPGDYHIYPSSAREKFVHVSNHDDGLRRTALPIWNVNNLTISGHGAKLIAHGQAFIPITIYNSSNITIEGLTIDWATPLHMQGTVTGIDPENNTFTAHMLDAENVFINRGRLLHGEGGSPLNGINDFTLKPNKEWWQNAEWTHWVDSQTGRPLPKSRQQPILEWHPRWKTPATFMDLGEGAFSFTNATASMPQVGDTFISKGLLMPNRMSPAIHMENASDIALKQVTIHHAGGMGLIAQRSSDITIDAMNVRLPEKSERWVTTTADATHFVLCKGDITVTNSYFEYMLDDALNVHGLSAVIRKQTGPASLECELIHFQQLGLEFAQPGERLRFSQQADLVPYGERKVKSYRKLNSSRFEVTFTEPIDTFLQPGSYLDNLDCNPDLTFSGNTVRNNRARSIIFSTAGKVVIENNRFEHGTMAAILIEGDANNWFESGPVEDVLIRNNTFVPLSPSSYILEFGPNEKGMKTLSDAPFHRNIRVTQNQFKLIGPRILHAHRIDGISFDANTVLTQADYVYSKAASIHIERSRNTKVSGNRFDLPNEPVLHISE